MEYFQLTITYNCYLGQVLPLFVSLSREYWKGWHQPHLKRPWTSLPPKILARAWVTIVPENETLSSSESKRGHPNVSKYGISLNPRDLGGCMRTSWYMYCTLLQILWQRKTLPPVITVESDTAFGGVWEENPRLMRLSSAKIWEVLKLPGSNEDNLQ